MRCSSRQTRAYQRLGRGAKTCRASCGCQSRTASFHLGLKVEHTKHLHAVERDRVLLIHYADVAKAEGFNQCLNDDVMGHWIMGRGPATSVPVLMDSSLGCELVGLW